MTKLFAIGDLHLSFSSDKPMGIFGENWNSHHQKIEKSWKESISEKDVVFIPGDLSWALKFEDAVPDLEWLHNLPGIKVFLKGNHDLWWGSVSKLRSLWPENMRFIQNDCLSFAGDKEEFVLCGTRGWVTPEDKYYKAVDDEKIYNRELLRLRMSINEAIKTGIDNIILGLHFPPTGGGMKSGFTELIEEYEIKTVLYGHLHGYEAYKKGIKGLIGTAEYHLISADYLDFSPRLIAEY